MLLGERREGRIDLPLGARIEDRNFEIEPTSGYLCVFCLRSRFGNVWIVQ